ncbi:hypothetical protein GCM10028791_30350 [Echinicola sediminis]
MSTILFHKEKLTSPGESINKIPAIKPIGRAGRWNSARLPNEVQSRLNPKKNKISSLFTYLKNNFLLKESIKSINP